MGEELTDPTQYIGRHVTLTIDRPIGTPHPEHGFLYPVNYGFLPDTLSPDGEPLDAYLLGVGQACRHFHGKCIAVIHRLDDADDKLVVVPAGTRLTDDEIRRLTHFQEQWFRSTIIR